jgi:chemotaxis protein CheD
MGATEQPGKFADTAIPGMIDELGKLTGRKGKSHLWAKIIGGARMFPGGPALNIGQKNQDAVEKILAELGLPVVARDVGGDMGRRVTFDTASGLVCIRAPGGEDYHI